MINKIKKSILKFIHIESSSSLVLAFATILALTLANSEFAKTYFDLLNFEIFNLSVSHWINDGLMAVFFFLVGLEIKKELTIGELNSLKKASFPIAAALGGMIVPAIIYDLFNSNPPASHGWGIPMATDIAFALGVLTIFGKRVPLALKILLLAVAIVDDLGAIIVIALFYTAKINWLGFLISIAALFAILLFKHLKISAYLAYLPFGIILWIGVLYSGVHATIAGVVLGVLTPINFKGIDSKEIEPVEHLIKALHFPVSFLIMPIFALANAGVAFNTSSILAAVSTDLFKGIFFGLVFGKPIGILLFSYFSYKFKLSSMPIGLRWKHIFLLGCLAGIGFTMSLFISKLALASELEQIAKISVLAASVTAILLSVLFGLFLNRNKIS